MAQRGALPLDIAVLFLAMVAACPLANAQRNGCTRDHQLYTGLNASLFYTGQRWDYSDAQRYQRVKKNGTASLVEFLKTRIVAKLTSGQDAQEVASYLSCIQDDSDSTLKGHHMSLRAFDPATTNTPRVFIEKTAIPTAVSAVVVNRGGGTLPDTKPLVECFAKSEIGGWQSIGEVGKDFEGQTLFAYPLKSPFSSETWFLLSGRHFGDTGGRLLVEIWGCDGRKLEMKWKRSGMRWGEATVQGDGTLVSLSYEPASSDRISHLVRRTEVFRVTEKGLQ
jgi:hypothetical protein